MSLTSAASASGVIGGSARPPGNSHRTAYPRFKRSISVRELREAYSPSLDELEWARQMTDSDEALLSLTMCLKCCQRLGYFARFDEVPASIVDHLRQELGLHESGRGDLADVLLPEIWCIRSPGRASGYARAKSLTQHGGNCHARSGDRTNIGRTRRREEGADRARRADQGRASHGDSGPAVGGLGC